MVDSQDPRLSGKVHEIAPFKPAANNPKQSIEDVAIAVDELDNMAFVVQTLLLENTNNSQELRAAITILGAMQPHFATLKRHCTQ